ncbi:hypothetical protein [Chenggangzhangella methanolivorans]|uniref:Uncharacterized protein n=1 Tax=Chenggangzhangella methanolivorans TaxID=1437009 RepID=A0A9E6RHR3_9HYPH|nr:hypothetical protein [Chenggangzhangella methanolivorans]QZO01252.1 hypothetical protein K6K41_06905 [Chenggangzhangella methanolivorans]
MEAIASAPKPDHATAGRLAATEIAAAELGQQTAEKTAHGDPAERSHTLFLNARLREFAR